MIYVACLIAGMMTLNVCATVAVDVNSVAVWDPEGRRAELFAV